MAHAEVPATPSEPELTPVEPVEEQYEQPELTTVRAPEEAADGEEMYDVPLGTLVYRSGLLSADQIESAVAQSEEQGKRLGEADKPGPPRLWGGGTPSPTRACRA